VLFRVRVWKRAYCGAYWNKCGGEGVDKSAYPKKLEISVIEKNVSLPIFCGGDEKKKRGTRMAKVPKQTTLYRRNTEK